MNNSDRESPAIGIDFGGTTVKCGLVSGPNILNRGAILETKAYDTPQALIAALGAEVARLRTPDVNAVGVGLPGFVDSTNGVVHQLTNVRGWSQVPLARMLSEQTGLPVSIENDANAMTYAEWKYGAARNHTNVVCITLGTGVGGGLILDGDLYRGSQLVAGEIGQISIDPHGVPGTYGNFGALEKYVGNRQIATRAQELYLREGRQLPLEECSPHLLAKKAGSGDLIAIGLWQQIGVDIALALANIAWLLNPDAIVIGGGVANAGEVLFESIRQTISRRTAAMFSYALRIVPAALGSDAGLIGAAVLAADLNVSLA